MSVESRLFEARIRLFGGPLVDGELAFWDRPPNDELRQSYFCTVCRQRMAKDDLVAIFHHRQRGHRPLGDEARERGESLSEQLTQAFDRSFPPS